MTRTIDCQRCGAALGIRRRKTRRPDGCAPFVIADADSVLHQCPAAGMDTPCLIWRWARNTGGYAQTRHFRVLQLVNRIQLGITGRPWLQNSVLHACDNPPCINPHHIRVGTHRENRADCAAKGRTGARMRRP